MAATRASGGGVGLSNQGPDDPIRDGIGEHITHSLQSTDQMAAHAMVRHHGAEDGPQRGRRPGRGEVRTVSDRCRTEADAYEFLEELRWHGTPICAHCGNDRAYFLKPRNGVSRATGPKRTQSVRRVYKCAACRKQFSVLTNTIFHGTKVELRTWLLVLVQVSSAKNGISAREVERMHGVTSETAWHMLHRIREAMKRELLAGLLTGTIVADETWIGGKAKNRHKSVGHVPELHTPVMSLLHKETGEVRSRVIPTVDGRNLREHLEANVTKAGSELHTDQLRAYVPVGWEFDAHKSVNHNQGQYVHNDGASTNALEGFFSQMKRSIDGTHHAVSTTHLHRYVVEHDFRYSTRKLSDTERLERIIANVEGRRLPYQPLVTR